MKGIFKGLVAAFAIFGAFMLAITICVAVEDACPKTENKRATPAEFVSITPRVDWPERFDEFAGPDSLVESSFISSFEASGVTLDADQRQVVRFVIVPRLKELMARSIDKARKQGLTTDEEIVRVMVDDCMVNSPRYGKAMAQLLRVKQQPALVSNTL